MTFVQQLHDATLHRMQGTVEKHRGLGPDLPDIATRVAAGKLLGFVSRYCEPKGDVHGCGLKFLDRIHNAVARPVSHHAAIGQLIPIAVECLR